MVDHLGNLQLAVAEVAAAASILVDACFLAPTKGEAAHRPAGSRAQVGRRMGQRVEQYVHLLEVL